MDIVTLDQESLRIWQDLDREQLRYEYDLKEGDKVLDIGAYRHEWGNEIEKRYKCQVEYFEALDNRAAWVYDGEIRLGGAFLYSSMFLEGSINYKCVDIAPYLQKEVALVKINIEGGEYELLNYIIDKGLIGNVKYLQVQFHLIEGINAKEQYGKLAKRLSETHHLDWRYPFCWESWKIK